MITLRQIINRDFILVHSDQPAAQAMQAVGRLKATYVIVRRWEAGIIYHYLYTAQAFLDQLANAAANQPLLEALNLHEWSATPSLNLYADAESAPERCVITEGDHVVGFYDAQVPPLQTMSTRGESKDVSPAEAPVTRLLHTEFPETIENGQTESLLVSLVRALGQKQAGSFTAQLGTQVDIVVSAQQGFVLEGTHTGSLCITDQDETPPIQFKLRATEIGPGRIRVLAFQGGRSIGEVIITPLIVAAGENTTNGSSNAREQLELHTGAPPDLMLLITNASVNEVPQITLQLYAADPAFGLNFQKFGPIKLMIDPLKYFDNLYTKIDISLDGKTDTPRAREIARKKFEQQCAAMSEELLPEDLNNVLWKYRKQIRTLLVQSDEPSIPWELLMLRGEDGQNVERPHLCEAFAMTRWFTGKRLQPALHLQNMAIIIQPNSNLVSANEEQTYLESLRDAKRYVTPVPTDYLEVMEQLEKGAYDSWHFTGHGHFKPNDANGSPIELTGPENTLCVADVSGDVVKNFKNTKPLVFLNACHTGQQGLSLTGIGGWAEQFVSAGAAGFIGSVWSVDDDAACAFAKAVYGHLLSGEPIGQAVQKAREVIKKRGDMNYLAYTVFADPFAKVI